MQEFFDQPRYVQHSWQIRLLCRFLGNFRALVHRERGGGGQAVEVLPYETSGLVMVEHLYGATFDPPIGWVMSVY